MSVYVAESAFQAAATTGVATVAAAAAAASLSHSQHEYIICERSSIPLGNFTYD